MKPSKPTFVWASIPVTPTSRSAARLNFPTEPVRTFASSCFAQGEHLKAAQEAGAEYVGGAELAEKIIAGWTDFEAVVATPDMMREVGKLGKVLGPRGLMPNPKTGTVTFDVAQAVKSLKAGRVEYRLDRNAIIHAALGKMNFTDAQIVENVASYLDAIIKARPSSVKGTYVKSISISSTMGPGIKVAYEGSKA